MLSDSVDSIKISPQVTVIYGCGQNITGQRLAMEIMINGLRNRGWQVNVVKTPLFDRSGVYSDGQRFRQKLVLGLNLARAWAKGLWLASRPNPICVGLGQTRFAMLRDGLPLLARKLFRRNQQAVIALNGSLFMNWDIQGPEARLFRNLVKSAHYVTVVGPNQKRRLVELGIASEKGVHLDNACLLSPITEQQCIDKQMISTIQPIKILYLSNLLEAKGYVEFVESIRQLAIQDRFPMMSTLCGPIMVMDSDIRFQTRLEATGWIEEQVDCINQSNNVQMQWINGAAGKVKENLFREAHIFILPSFYKVEAQPLAILEALASGCAVITSTTGEIPTMVSAQTAILLDEISPKTIAEAIVKLQNDSDERRQMAVNGLQLFKDRFAYEKHIDRWESLLLSIN